MSDNQKSNCDVYPCVITKAAYNETWVGCESGHFGSGKKDGNTGCSSCCWMCFPLTITADILCAIPFGITYGIKKCKEKNDQPVITIQPN